MSVVALAAVCLAQQGAALRLVRSQGQLFLVEGNRRILIEGTVPAGLKFAGGILSFGYGKPTSIETSAGVRTLDLQTTLGTWLEDDAKWGGHAQANQLRYRDQRNGTTADLSQVSLNRDGTALAVMTLTYPSISEPIAAQALVRLKPSGALNFVRPLSFEDSAAYASTPATRIFARAGHRVLIDNGHVWTIDDSGKVCKSIANFDRAAPIGCADGRFMILVRATQEGSDIDAFDLHSLKSSPLYREKDVSGSQSTYIFHIPAEGRYLLLSRSVINGPTRMFTVHIPDGRMAEMPDRPFLTWRQYAVEKNGSEVIVYRASDGRQVARLS